jgi:hypothetical protein
MIRFRRLLCCGYLGTVAVAACAAADDPPVSAVASQELYVYGSEDGDARTMLHQVGSVAFDADDNLFILDGGNYRVLVVDAAGRHVREFGRRGAGPGEFQAPLSIAVASDGTIIVHDNYKRAFLRFTTEGELIEEVPRSRRIGPLWPSGEIAAVPGMALVVQTSGAPGSGLDGPLVLRHPLSADAEPTVLYRLPEVPQAGPGGPPVFRVLPRMTVLPSGSVALRLDHTYAVPLIDPAGTHTRTLSRTIEPRRVSRQDQEAWGARQRDANRSAAERAAAAGANVHTVAPPVDDAVFAEHVPVISRIGGDALGRVWVQRFTDTGEESGEIDLFDETGTFLGTLPPQPFPDASSPSGRAAYIVRDELGIERVAVRRIPGETAVPGRAR